MDPGEGPAGPARTSAGMVGPNIFLGGKDQQVTQSRVSAKTWWRPRGGDRWKKGRQVEKGKPEGDQTRNLDGNRSFRFYTVWWFSKSEL